MNLFEGPKLGKAKIKYLDGDYQVLSSGTYVECAVTAKHIPIEELKYWNVTRQEAYIDVQASFKRESELR